MHIRNKGIFPFFLSYNLLNIMKDKDTKTNEKELYLKVKNKEKEAFMEGYDLYVDDIYRFIYFKVGNQEDAKDLTSLVFLKTWNHIKNNSLESSKTLRALFYKVARNAIIDFYRKQQENQPLSDQEGNFIDIADYSQDMAKKVEISSDMELIRQKMNELKSEYREVIILKYINELSLKEIAEITGKSTGNARVLIHRALKALRELLEEKN